MQIKPLRRLARWLNGPRYSRVEMLVAVLVGYVIGWMTLG
jgi:hypothetical protein